MKKLLLLTSKQLFGYALAGLSSILGIPTLFLLFYFIFYYEGSFTETGISIFIWMALISAFVAFMFRIIKIEAMKHKSPILGAFPRAIQTNRYLILLTIIYTLFSIQFTSDRIRLFLWLCVLSRALSKIIEGVSLKMFELNWSDEV